MANTFSRKTSRNVGTSLTAVGGYTVGGGTTTTIIGLNLANTTTAPVTVDVTLNDSVNDCYLLKGAVVPVGGALAAIGGDEKVVLITNAHRDSLSLKLERIELAPYFDRLISSHDYGFPKEDQQFWHALQQDISFTPARSLFIDDSLPILRSAGRFGVGHLLAVRQPDSQAGPKDTEEFAAVEDYRALVQGL